MMLRTVATCAVAWTFIACNASRATRAECARILERIVEIELRERGYRDPLLKTLKHTELKRKLATELDACVGRPLNRSAMACVENAQEVEKLTHVCLSR
jgi:hypothetical protein